MLCISIHAAAHFNTVSQQVVLATDEVAVVQVVQPLGVRKDIVQSHSNSISGVAYSACFNHLITACTDGVCFGHVLVKVEDLMHIYTSICMYNILWFIAGSQSMEHQYWGKGV